MKSQRITLFLLLILVIVITGCTSTNKLNEANQNLEISNEKVKELENELTQTTKKLAESNDKITKLESDLNDLKNGAQLSIIEIRKQYESKTYDKVVELSATLHTKFPGVPEDKEAQALVKKIEEVKAEAAKKAEAEKLKLLAEQSKSAKEKARAIIRISSSYPSKPNSAGGVDFRIKWINNSDKVIKYIIFVVKPYNAVNDQVSSEIGGGSLYRGKSTGPFKKGQGNDGSTYWECAWYNNSIKTIKIDSVEIEYMDGTEITLKDDDMEYIQY